MVTFENVAPVTHAPQTVLDEAEHAALMKLPLLHEEHVEHGAKPVADQVAPVTQGAAAIHASCVAFQTLPSVQLQLDCPTSMPTPYPVVDGHGVQLASPADEKKFAGHCEQAKFAVLLQTLPATGVRPAAQAELHAVQGARPVAE